MKNGMWHRLYNVNAYAWVLSEPFSLQEQIQNKPEGAQFPSVQFYNLRFGVVSSPELRDPYNRHLARSVFRPVQEVVRRRSARIGGQTSDSAIHLLLERQVLLEQYSRCRILVRIAILEGSLQNIQEHLSERL